MYVPRTGFEPVTLCLEGRCSIQLSYRGIIIKIMFQLLRRIIGNKTFYKKHINLVKDKINLSRNLILGYKNVCQVGCLL